MSTPTPPPPPPAPPADSIRTTAPPPRAAAAGRSSRVPTLRRDPDDRLIAGVCAGFARTIGVDPLVVRVASIAFALAGGVGIALYLIGWSISEERAEVAEDVRITRRQTIAVGLVALGLLLLLRDVGLWLGDGLVLPVTLGAIGSAVIWARSDDDDRDRWRGMRRQVPGSPEEDHRTAPVRLIVGAILIAIGVTTVLAANNALLDVRNVVLSVVTALAGAALVFGPWVARLVRELGEERRDRIRGEERAEVAAHLHDSVLQTLALIQRSADNPRRMVTLARSQERELRAWLYGRRDVDDADATLRGLLDAALVQVESSHDLDVDLVVVGDMAPDEDARALVAAVREALNNAGSHAGVPTASVYVEIDTDEVVAYVRDRGAGFDPAAVSPDRRGVADSIKGRLRRHGGRATLTTAPGDGTEWEFVLPRRTPTQAPTADDATNVATSPPPSPSPATWPDPRSAP